MTGGRQQTEAALIIEETGQTFPLGRETITIGRKAGHTIVLANDAAISRHHATISWQAGRHLIQDAGSANGTYLNEHRLTEPTPLSHGDILRLGQTRLLVQLPQLLPAHISAVTEPLPETPEVTSAPPEPTMRTTTEIIEIPLGSLRVPFGELPILRDRFVLQGSHEFKGNYNIFEPDSGQLLFKCMQVQDLVKSLLKPAGHHFDCWLRTPDDKPILRITKSITVLTAKPILVRDERDQIMGEIRQTGKAPVYTFEVLDAIQDPLFKVESVARDFKFTTGGLECALLRHTPASSFQNISGGEAILLEISGAVPTHVFIRQMILAAAIAVSLASSGH
jgi:pSer/pThr/pTyr-binding forkhead associated (FHA) protein